MQGEVRLYTKDEVNFKLKQQLKQLYDYFKKEDDVFAYEYIEKLMKGEME